jgi:HK97 family phage major capsid protein
VAEASTAEPKFIPETRDQILGKPWQEVSHMTTTVAGTTVAYGDIGSAYRIVDRVGMQVELIPHLFGSNRRPTGERGLYGYARVGGRVQNADAVRRLVTS